MRTSDEFKATPTKIPDGRRNSCGEKLPSPVENWKPNIARWQSWNREDLKHEYVVGELLKKKDEGMGTGFTEVNKEQVVVEGEVWGR